MTEPVKVNNGETGRVGFSGYSVRRLSFVEILPAPVPVAAPVPGESKPITLNLSVAIGLVSESMAEVTLSASMKPDPSAQPYEIEAVLSGVFVAHDGTKTDALQRFCQLNAPVILWPYLRAAVHQVTMDGRYGPVRMDPVNLAALLGQKPWQAMPQQPAPLENPITGSSSSQ